MSQTSTNFTDSIFEHARAFPKGAALADDHDSLTWKQLADLVGRAAVWLDGQGIRPGDPVGVRMTNSIDHIILTLALMRVGAAKAEFGTGDTGRKFDVMMDTLKIGTLFAEPPMRSLGKVRCISIGLDWRDGLKKFKGDHKHPDDFEPYDVALSSGSTGVPKGIRLTHAQLSRRIADYEPSMTELQVFSKYAKGTFFLTSSMSFAGFLYSMLNRLALGGKVYVMPEFVRLADFIRGVAAQKDSILMLTSMMCEELISCAPEEGLLFPEAQAMLSMGTPLAARAKREMLARVTPNFMEVYGSSGSGLISVLRSEDIAEHSDSVGRLFSGVEVEIVDSNDAPVAPGVTGHLRCRGSGVSPEVIGQAPVSRFEGFRDGWFYSGDMAMFDEQGYLHLRGRVSDLVRRRGVDIMPTTIELALMSHPGVQEAAVIGLVRGEVSEIVAVIQPRGAPDTQAFHSHCIDRLGAGQAPGGYLYVKAFPRTAGGKIDRAKLKARVEQEVSGGGRSRRTV